MITETNEKMYTKQEVDSEADRRVSAALNKEKIKNEHKEAIKIVLIEHDVLDFYNLLENYKIEQIKLILEIAAKIASKKVEQRLSSPKPVVSVKM